MAEAEATILPIYFVADESGSMMTNVNQMNQGLTSLLDAMQGEAMAASKVRFSIIGFHDLATCHLPLADFRQLEGMPTLGAYGSTSFASAFQDLQSRIPADVKALKDQGYLVNRPAVFFLTDGYPNGGDGWEQLHADLVDPGFKARPNILAFGIGAADPTNIRAIATKPEFAFIADSSMDTGAALTKFMVALTQSIIKSGHASSDGQAGFQLEEPEGFISLDLV